MENMHTTSYIHLIVKGSSDIQKIEYCRGICYFTQRSAFSEITQKKHEIIGAALVSLAATDVAIIHSENWQGSL